jgi:Fe2+ transport system protein FeoA
MAKSQHWEKHSLLRAAPKRFPLTRDRFEVILWLLEELKFIFNIAHLYRRGNMSLLDALHNEMYRVEGVAGPADERRRLLDLGITPGEELAVVQSVPLGDPLVIMVRGMRLALRRREAGWISIQ